MDECCAEIIDKVNVIIATIGLALEVHSKNLAKYSRNFVHKLNHSVDLYDSSIQSRNPFESIKEVQDHVFRVIVRNRWVINDILRKRNRYDYPDGYDDMVNRVWTILDAWEWWN